MASESADRCPLWLQGQCADLGDGRWQGVEAAAGPPVEVEEGEDPDVQGLAEGLVLVKIDLVEQHIFVLCCQLAQLRRVGHVTEEDIDRGGTSSRTRRANESGRENQGPSRENCGTAELEGRLREPGNRTSLPDCLSLQLPRGDSDKRTGDRGER